MWLSLGIRRGDENVRLISTLLKWAKSPNRTVRVTDSCLGPMCNPTCPEVFAFVDSAVQWSDFLNGVVLFMSLVMTVLSVVLKIVFVVKFALLKRVQERCLKQHESVKVNIRGSALSVFEVNKCDISLRAHSEPMIT